MRGDGRPGSGRQRLSPGPGRISGRVGALGRPVISLPSWGWSAMPPLTQRSGLSRGSRRPARLIPPGGCSRSVPHGSGLPASSSRPAALAALRPPFCHASEGQWSRSRPGGERRAFGRPAAPTDSADRRDTAPPPPSRATAPRGQQARPARPRASPWPRLQRACIRRAPLTSPPAGRRARPRSEGK